MTTTIRLLQYLTAGLACLSLGTLIFSDITARWAESILLFNIFIFDMVFPIFIIIESELKKTQKDIITDDGYKTNYLTE